MTNIASTYRNQGQWMETEELVVQIMGTKQRHVGIDSGIHANFEGGRDGG